MKQVEDLHKVVKELVDLTNIEDNNSASQLTDGSIKMPELALVMAKYFTSLGKYCLSCYNSYDKKQKKQQKPKPILQQSKVKAPPRKPISAYITYYQEKVPIFQQKYPNCSIAELTRLIAKQWSDLTEEDKLPYKIKAAQNSKPQNEQRKVSKNTNKQANQLTKSVNSNIISTDVIEDFELEIIKEKMEAEQKQEEISEHKEN